MAFKYPDGQTYLDDFHYLYVNGRKPKQELKIVLESEGEVVCEEREGGRLTHSRGGSEHRKLGHRPGWCK